MAASCGELGLFAGNRHRLLRARDRRGRFERDTEENILAVADAALDPSGAVADCADPPLIHDIRIVVPGAGQTG